MSLDDLAQVGGVGILGSVVGGLLTFFGVKERIEDLEKSVVYKDTCSACKEGRKDAEDALKDRLDRQEGYLIEILRNIKGGG